MHYIQVLQDSIETSITLKIFTSKEEATMKHIFNSELISFPLSNVKNLKTLILKDFNHLLLKHTLYIIDPEVIKILVV